MCSITLITHLPKAACGVFRYLGAALYRDATENTLSAATKDSNGHDLVDLNYPGGSPRALYSGQGRDQLGNTCF